MTERRNIAVCILLSIVTCGIYQLYWMACVANDVNRVSGRDGDVSGGMVVLFSIITCNIYGLFWMYQAGNKIDDAREVRGVPRQSNQILYLVLSLLGFGIVSISLMQNELNNMY